MTRKRKGNPVRRRAYYLAHREKEIKAAVDWNRAHPEEKRAIDRDHKRRVKGRAILAILREQAEGARRHRASLREFITGRAA